MFIGLPITTCLESKSWGYKDPLRVYPKRHIVMTCGIERMAGLGQDKVDKFTDLNC